MLAEGANMVVVDTSVWVSHFRNSSVQLQKLLLDREVLCHPFIIGELACGRLHNRKEILSLLQNLPQAQTAEHEEILALIEYKKLFGLGIGLVDIHLLASALLTKVALWTLDKRLRKVAVKLELLYSP